MTGRRFSTIFSNGSGSSSFAAQDHYPFWRSSSNALTLADKPHLTQCVCTRTSVYSAQRPHCAQDPYPVVRVVSSRIQAHRPSATVAPLASHTVAQNPFEQWHAITHFSAQASTFTAQLAPLSLQWAGTLVYKALEWQRSPSTRSVPHFLAPRLSAQPGTFTAQLALLGASSSHALKRTGSGSQ